ncbi:MAG: glutamate 5-kinase [Leptonema sp. (in: bacteria)]
MSREILKTKWNEIKRIVIKIGSNLIVDPTTNQICTENIQNLVRGILFLKNNHKDVILVSSGAVAFGKKRLNNAIPKDQIPLDPSLVHKQAFASIGQIELMNFYRKIFRMNQLEIAQILITAKDFRDRETYLNVGHTIQELIKLNIIPIINENDTVSTDELKFGDNDFLSAAVSALLNCQLLILLTSVDGFLINGERISTLNKIDKQIFSYAKGPEGYGSGGMYSKIRVGSLCLKAGVDVAILPGKEENIIEKFFNQEDVGTFIYSKEKKFLKARKRWLLFSRTKGAVYIDEGAEIALLKKGSSLLINGIKEIEGKFTIGDVVEIKNLKNEILGRGIINLSHKNLKKYLENKMQNNKIYNLSEVINRDDLILEVTD